MPTDANDDRASPAGSEPVHRRRPRYRGAHPRRFDEKYKEHDPDRHPDTVAKVLASGKTPAGSHRPVLVAEVLEALSPREGEIGVDATLGHGGHAQALLERIGGGRLIGIDADPLELPRTEALLRARGFGPETFVAVHGNMAALPAILVGQGLEAVDFVLADLGCSSMQLDDPARGFSHKLDGPLDLRMNPRKGQPASALLARIDAPRLARLLRENGDEPRADEIAAAIVAARDDRPLQRTTELSRVVASALPKSANEKATLARVFQSIRMEVNGEASALEAFLRALPSCLNSDGRVAVLTFHSGEDRRVKRAFRDGVESGDYVEVARDVVRPTRREIASNPRAASAKLRRAVKR